MWTRARGRVLTTVPRPRACLVNSLAGATSSADKFLILLSIFLCSARLVLDGARVMGWGSQPYLPGSTRRPCNLDKIRYARYKTRRNRERELAAHEQLGSERGGRGRGEGDVAPREQCHPGPSRCIVVYCCICRCLCGYLSCLSSSRRRNVVPAGNHSVKSFRRFPEVPAKEVIIQRLSPYWVLSMARDWRDWRIR